MDRGNSTPYEENSASPALPAQPSALHLAPPSALSALPLASPFGNNSASPALPSGGSYATMAAECEGKGGKNMGRDMAKKAITDEKWKKENTRMYGIRVMNNTGIPAAMEKAQKDGHTTNAYIVVALREKLIADGYLSPSDEPEE